MKKWWPAAEKRATAAEKQKAGESKKKVVRMGKLSQAPVKKGDSNTEPRLPWRSTCLMTFPGEFARKIIVGVECPCSDDPRPPQAERKAHLAAGDVPGVGAAPRTRSQGKKTGGRRR